MVEENTDVSKTEGVIMMSDVLSKEQKLEWDLSRVREEYSELRDNISVYLAALPDIEINEGQEDRWERVYKANLGDDEYSRAGIECAVLWAKALQPLAGRPLKGEKVVFNTLCMVDCYGLTGFQVECIIHLLREFWKYG